MPGTKTAGGGVARQRSFRGVPAIAANPREGSRLLRFWINAPKSAQFASRALACAELGTGQERLRDGVGQLRTASYRGRSRPHTSVKNMATPRGSRLFEDRKQAAKKHYEPTDIVAMIKFEDTIFSNRG
jgi:hypothetical protein